MQKNFRLFSALFVFVMVALACAIPVSGITPAQPANVETIVAATFAALTASAPESGVTPLPLTDSLLPHSIYFLNTDSASRTQVYRLDNDGKTVTQVTFEPANVESYDVSLADGSVVYVSNNQLFTINAEGSNRSMIVDGGAVDPNNIYLNQISTPLWSSDGQAITYGHHGLSAYSIVNGQSIVMYADQLTTENGLTLGVVHTPIRYSPDDSKLLINMIPLSSGGGAVGIFSPGNTSVLSLTGANHRICCSLQWSGDSNSLYGGYAGYNPFVTPGLWRVDAASGVVTDLVPAFSNNDSILNFVLSPFLAPDGQLYYFYAAVPYTQQDEVTRAPLQLVRSAADGVTNRTIVFADIFNTLNEALWAPDANLVITVSGPIAEVYQGGIVELYYTDGQKPPISLLNYAFDLRWGP